MSGYQTKSKRRFKRQTNLAPSWTNLDNEEVRNLFRNYHQARAAGDGIGSRNIIVERYRPFVEFLANSVYSRMPDEVELDDLVSEGVFGLMDAIDGFDLGRGTRFETYATLRINGAMMDYLRTLDNLGRVPRQRFSAYESFKTKFQMDESRQVSDEEVDEALRASYLRIAERIIQEKGPEYEAYRAGLESKKHRKKTRVSDKEVNKEIRGVHLGNAQRIIEAHYHPHRISMDQELGDYEPLVDLESLSLRDLLEDRKTEDPGRRLAANDALKVLIRGLNYPDQLLMILYYYEGLTMKETAAQLPREGRRPKSKGVSESRISQRHARAIEMLRNDPRIAEYFGIRIEDE